MKYEEGRYVPGWLLTGGITKIKRPFGQQMNANLPASSSSSLAVGPCTSIAMKAKNIAMCIMSAYVCIDHIDL